MEICYVHSFTFDNGQTYTNIPAAYTLSTARSSNRDDVILVLHAFSGDSDVLVWWSKFVGEHKMIDTRYHTVICINTLAGCNGSFGPLTIDEKTGEPFGDAFVHCTIADLARFQFAVLDTLQVKKIKTCIAISMGGVVGMQMQLQRPNFCDTHFQVAAAPLIPFEFQAIQRLMKEAILLDRSKEKQGGMRIARSLGMVFFQTNGLNAERFGADSKLYQAYLDKQNMAFEARFNWVSYVRLLEAMEDDHFDYMDPRLQLMKTTFIFIAIEEDRCFPYSGMLDAYERLKAVGLDIVLHTISSKRGHDSFLLEPEKYTIFKDYIEGGC